MRADANRVRRLNQQLDVWRSHSPSYISEVEDRLMDQTTVNTSKDGSKLIFSARNMTQQEYEEQERIMKYFEKNIGTYTEFQEEISERIEEETGEKPTRQEDVDRFIELLANYDSLITELFRHADGTDLANGYFLIAENEYMTLEDRVFYLEDIIEKGIPYDQAVVDYAIQHSYGFD